MLTGAPFLLMTSLRHGLRSLADNRGFSFVAVATLGVCIAANAAIFSVYDRLVLHPIDVPDPGSLVAIWANSPPAALFAPAVSWPQFQELRRSARSFTSMGDSAFDSFALTAPGAQPLQVNALRISGEFFKTLGVRPLFGRDFIAAEDVTNGPNVCILSHEFWTTRFGARESIVGQTIQLNEQSWQVVGILPPHLTQPFTRVQVFVPRVFELTGLTRQAVDVGAGYTQPIARLAPGVTTAQATSELASISQAYGKEFSDNLDAKTTSVPRDYAAAFVGTLKPTFYTLLGAVAFVLLIACANVASLYVGRLSNRQKDIAVRLSLGATRATVVRELLTEGVLIAVGAGLAAAALARWALGAIATMEAAQLPPDTVLALNWRAWAFIAGVALISGVLVSLVPALQASKADIVTVLKDATRGSSGARGGRLRSGLIVVEVALSVVLLVGSSLLLVSFISLERTPPGFDPAGIATAYVGVPVARYATGQAQVDFFARVADELRRDPLITHAATSFGLPVAGYSVESPYGVSGQPIPPLANRPLAVFDDVSEDYFATLQIPIVMGRAFTAADRNGAPAVCIISQSLAERLFPTESPIGHVLLRGKDATIPEQIVGVAGNVKTSGVNAPSPDEIYYPTRQYPQPRLNVLVRTTGDPDTLQTAIRAAVAAVDHEQPVALFQSLDDLLSQSLGVQRLVATLTTCFAVLALLLAAVGLYSVVAYAVAQRTGEIGIRMALGARPSQVVSLIMTGGLRLVAVGVVLGLAGAAGTAHLIATLLSNVEPLDPLVYGSVALFFGLVAVAACFVPSFRASRIDPVLALGDRVRTR